MIKQIDVGDLRKILGGGGCQLVDVRESGEFSSGGRVAEARLLPLSEFEKRCEEVERAKPVYLMCRSGVRAGVAAEKLLKKGFTEVYVVKGGMLAWARADLPVIKGELNIWSLERQVRFAAGLLVFLGAVMSLLIHPYIMALSAFVGAGLVFAAVTDSCGMAMILARMPWNKAIGAACETTTQKA